MTEQDRIKEPLMPCSTSRPGRQPSAGGQRAAAKGRSVREKDMAENRSSRGRKRRTWEKKSEVLSVAFTLTQYDEASDEAFRLSVSFSELVRRSLQAHLDATRAERRSEREG